MEPVRWIATPSGWLMVLRQGDDVLNHLEELMRAEHVQSGCMTGFGFVEHARFGFFDFDKQDYAPGDFHDLEITAFTGTLAWMDGSPAVHAHASGGDSSFRMAGGHVLRLVVGRGSFEISITNHTRRLERAMDQAIGAKVLQLD